MTLGIFLVAAMNALESDSHPRKKRKLSHSAHVVEGATGLALYINDYRVAGPKPWGGGNIVHTFAITDEDLAAACKRLR